MANKQSIQIGHILTNSWYTVSIFKINKRKNKLNANNPITEREEKINSL